MQDHADVCLWPVEDPFQRQAHGTLYALRRKEVEAQREREKQAESMGKEGASKIRRGNSTREEGARVDEEGVLWQWLKEVYGLIKFSQVVYDLNRAIVFEVSGEMDSFGKRTCVGRTSLQNCILCVWQLGH